MDIKKFHKEFRSKLKLENKKIIISNQELKITIFMNSGKTENYHSIANIDHSEKILNIKFFGRNGRSRDFKTLNYVLEYWIGFAKVNNLEKLQFNHNILVKKNHWSSNKRVSEDEFEFIETLGFKKKEEDGKIVFMMDIETYRKQIDIHEKMNSLFKEKNNDEVTMRVVHNNVTGHNVLFKVNLNWIGHECLTVVEYDYEKKLYTLKDTKNIKVEFDRENIENAVIDYFEKISKIRKIKNIYEPPVTNLKRFLSDKIYMREVAANDLMMKFIEKGYSNPEVEENAVIAIKNETFTSKETSKLGFFQKEIYFKFLNHYVLIYSSTDGKTFNSELFESEDELFLFYKNKINEFVDQKINEKKSKAI